MIEIDNPNLISKKIRLENGSLKSNSSSPKMTTNSSKSEQTRADLARLAIVRKQREEASKKRENDLALKNEVAKVKAENKSKGI